MIFAIILMETTLANYLISIGCLGPAPRIAQLQPLKTTLRMSYAALIHEFSSNVNTNCNFCVAIQNLRAFTRVPLSELNYRQEICQSMWKYGHLCASNQFFTHLKEFACELTSSWHPAREDGRSQAIVRGRDPQDPRDPQMGSSVCTFITLSMLCVKIALCLICFVHFCILIDVYSARGLFFKKLINSVVLEYLFAKKINDCLYAIAMPQEKTMNFIILSCFSIRVEDFRYTIPIIQEDRQISYY